MNDFGQVTVVAALAILARRVIFFASLFLPRNLLFAIYHQLQIFNYMEIDSHQRHPSRSLIFFLFVSLQAYFAAAALKVAQFNPVIIQAPDPLDSQWYYSAGNVALAIFLGKPSAGGGDCFVTKNNVNSSYTWVTLVGGNRSENCQTNSVVVHPDGSVVWLAGHTNSSFDGQTGSPAALFVSQINAANGSLQWTRFFSNFSMNVPTMILAYNQMTNSLIIHTTSISLIIARIALSSTPSTATTPPSVTWVQTFPGSTGAITAALLVSVSLEVGQKLFVTGSTTGTFNKQATSGVNEVFVARLNWEDGSVEMSQLYGGRSQDFARFMAFDSVYNALYVSGTTLSHSFSGETFDAVNTGVYVMRIDVKNVSISRWIRFFDSTGTDSCNALLIHPQSRNVYAIGTINGVLIESEMFSERKAFGGTDIYVAVFNETTGNMTLRVNGTLYAEGVTSAWFESNGRLMVHGTWAGVNALLTDSGTIGGDELIPETRTDDDKSVDKKISFIGSIFSTESSQLWFFVAVCVMGGIILIMSAVLGVTFMRQQRLFRKGDAERTTMMRSNQAYLIAHSRPQLAHSPNEMYHSSAGLYSPTPNRGMTFNPHLGGANGMMTGF